MKFALATLSAGLAAAALASAASAAPTVTLSLRYAGSTTTNPSALATNGFVTNGSGFTQNTNLTMLDLTQASSQTTAYKHYFDVGVTMGGLDFTSGAANEALRALLATLTISGQAQAVTPQGVAGGTSTKYFGFALTSDITTGAVFSSNGDAGTAGDLQDLNLISTGAQTAAYSQIGTGDTGGLGLTLNGGKTIPVPTYVGRFAISFTGPISSDVVLNLGPGTGQNFSYYTGNNPNGATPDTFVTGNTGIVGGSYTIGAGVPTPEPASLGVLAMGGLALLARRRKA